MSPRAKVYEDVLDRGGYCLRRSSSGQIVQRPERVLSRPAPGAALCYHHRRHGSSCRQAPPTTLIRDPPTHLDLPEALHESQSSTQPINALRRKPQDATDDEEDHDGQDKQMSNDEPYDHLASTTAALPTWDSHSSTTSAKPHRSPMTPRRNDKRPARVITEPACPAFASPSLNQLQNFTTEVRFKGQVQRPCHYDDDDDDDVGDKPRKRRRTEISLAVSDTEGTEDKTFQGMHSKPQYSTPYFDGPSNLARLVDVLTAPSLDIIKSDVGSAAKIFVSTPLLCEHHGAAPMFPGRLVSESDVKHRAFYKALMRQLPSALMQGRSELEDHIKRARGDSALLGTTMKSWHKNLEVTITDEHVCWWRVLWQAVKQPDRKATVEADLTGNEFHKTANVPESRSNSFAEKVNRLSSTLAEIAVDAYLEDEYKHGREFDHQRDNFLTDQLAPVMPVLVLKVCVDRYFREGRGKAIHLFGKAVRPGLGHVGCFVKFIPRKIGLDRGFAVGLLDGLPLRYEANEKG
ncbi:BZ3500_MvSof-1268-A1-R1_Chr3-3g06494 [Microbotryum saponariae]|uniref:BZ3500_MvSof-1268-A1-R1_Chr3-3g06494 protein n=1 Tax=Microbotryum saponariae TaxID=289078 RepID=A0A2X0LC74_9BASI|nr:BZ3500_MvSof-1268-A1-R1_Chr3-3g06494 [Microbotryum saponariae]SDA04461.1 BZ3501_MvSof-1269-A2-R1_Chr3-2g06181 [Microbotryum saponariae]